MRQEGEAGIEMPGCRCGRGGEGGYPPNHITVDSR